MDFLKKYGKMSYEEKMIVRTKITLCCSALLAAGKLAVGVFSDYSLCIIAIYTLALLLSKLECVLGTADGRVHPKRSGAVAAFLILSSIVYIGFMCGAMFRKPASQGRGLSYVCILAFISFTELGFALAGIFKTKRSGYFYRDIKIINFCMALIAILTTQTAILDYMGTEGLEFINAASGMAVGAFIAACAVYILVAPKISPVGREHNRFVCTEPAKNRIIYGPAVEIKLLKSKVYGDYTFCAAVEKRAESGEKYIVDGDIVRGQSLWKDMNILLKILCIVLSEILVFCWLAGRAVYFIRSAFIIGRLEKIMADNGFARVEGEVPAQKKD